MQVQAPVFEGIDDVALGKRLGEHTYLHISTTSSLPVEWQARIAKAAQLAGLSPETHLNVVKLHQDGDQLSLLDYTSFFDDPFPPLARSWRVSLSRNTVIFRTYEESRNPPILHRKELLLSPDDPHRPRFAAITESAEAIGLFADPNRIGFREYWYRLIAERGYELVGSEFVPLANATASTVSDAPAQGASVQRHLTALSRSNFSAPVQSLSRHGLVRPGVTFFDYGCGRGDDVRGLLANSIDATGWDPHFASDAEKRSADVVNIGFVINVIESMRERVEALLGAYAHCKGVLAIAAMLSSQAAPEGRPFNDGYMTSRKTFQKYFTQAQLRDFIEHTLEENAIAAGPGVFFVFRDKDLEQQFLSRRYGHRSPTILSRGWIRERPIREKVPRLDRNTRLFEEHRELFSALWLRLLELGRRPDKDELDNLAEIESVIGSLPKALRLVEARFDTRELELARNARSEDILVFLAMMQFEKRKPYRHLESRLQRDIRYFFGDYSSAQGLARQALYSLGDVVAIDKACRGAYEKGLGWLEEGQSLQLHVSLVERLPAVLRIFVGCATVLFGDISTFDLIKIHVRSGKVSLMKYEDFENSALPRLVQRVKVKLRDLDVNIFDYGTEYPPTLLYYKSRYINEEYHHYAEQVAFEEALERLKLFDFSGYGPPEAQLCQKLEQERWAIDGFNVIRSRRIPDLDERCGAHLTYRQLIECGETQAKTCLPNLPQEPESFTALYELCRNILDPAIEYFGMIELTYGFCSRELAGKISKRIAPELDQHASHERKCNGHSICPRLGAAVDFLIRDENMREVAEWIIANLPFDRLYFYGDNKPLHVSFGSEQKRDAIEMRPTSIGILTPRPYRHPLG
jgi:DNA phosphorothioation-associated putative methyltransferase